MTSQPIRLSTNIMTLKPSLTFTELRVASMEYLQRVCYASRERLPFRTPGSFPPFWDLLMLQLLRPVLLNLPCLFSTFHLEYTLGTFSILLYMILYASLSILVRWYPGSCAVLLRQIFLGFASPYVYHLTILIYRSYQRSFISRENSRYCILFVT